eukprot:1856291-Amphidinium_carterae.1
MRIKDPTSPSKTGASVKSPFSDASPATESKRKMWESPGIGENTKTINKSSIAVRINSVHGFHR